MHPPQNDIDKYIERVGGGFEVVFVTGDISYGVILRREMRVWQDAG